MNTRMKKVAGGIFATILVILISSPFILTWAVNKVAVKSKIALILSEKTGIHINPSNFSVKILPLPGLKMSHLQFSPADQIDIGVRSIKIDLDKSRLLQGEITLGKVLIAGPELRISLPQKKDAPAPLNVSPAHYISKLSALIDQLPRGQDTIELEITDGRSAYFENLDANLILLRDTKKIQIETRMKKIQSAPLSFAGPGVKKQIKLNHVTLDELQLELSLKLHPEKSPSLSGKCTMTSPRMDADNGKQLIRTQTIDLNFHLSEDRQKITVAPIELEYPSAIVGINFFSSREEKQARLEFTGRDIHVDQAREMTENLLTDVDVAQTLFEILLDGFVPQITVAFESPEIKTLVDGSNLLLSGTVHSGKVRIPETRLDVHDIKGDVGVRNGILEVFSPTGKIGTSIIKNGSLQVDLVNYEDVPFKGEFDLDVDLAMLPETLSSLLPGSLLSSEMARIHDVSGRCRSTLHLELPTGADEVLVHVNTEPFSARGRYNRVPGEISIETAQVNYEPEKIFLNDLTGTVNGSQIKEMSGSVYFADTTWIDIEKGTGEINLARIIPWFVSYKATRELISPFQKGDGLAKLSKVSLSGPLLDPPKWKYKASGELVGVSLSSPKSDPQVKNLFCRFKLSHTTQAMEHIRATVNSLEKLHSPPGQEYLDSLRTPFSIQDAHINISDTGDPSFSGELKFKTGPKLKLDLERNALSLLQLSTLEIKDADISDARVTFSSSPDKPLFNLRGHINTNSLVKIFKPKSFLGDKLHDLTDGQPILIHTDKDNTLNIITENLNLDTFLSSPAKKQEESMQMITKDLINFKAKNLKFRQLNFKDVDTKISFKKNHAYLRLKSANLCELNTSGYINIKNGKIYANIPMDARNKENIQQLLSCLFKKDSFMDGQYSLSSTLIADGVPTDEAKKRIQGNLALDARQGRIYKLTLLSRILSVLNVSKVFKGKIPNIVQTGFAYNTITIRAKIKNSVIHLEEAVIDGQDMTMIFTGYLDPIQDKINLTCLVAPFKTVDLIIEKIPVVNTLLGGRLVSVPVKATGKMSDPTVIPLHPSAVGKGLVDMMSRIVKSPVTLWEKMVGEE